MLHSLKSYWNSKGCISAFLRTDEVLLRCDFAPQVSLLFSCTQVWVQTGKVSEWLRNEYITAIEGVKGKLIRQSVPNGLTFVGELHQSEFSTKMVSFSTISFLRALFLYVIKALNSAKDYVRSHLLESSIL